MKYESIKQGSVKHDTIDGCSVTVENGIAFFDEPYLVDDASFSGGHPRCDFILKLNNSDGQSLSTIFAVATKPEFNDILEREYNERGYSNMGCIIMCGMDDVDGVMYID